MLKKKELEIIFTEDIEEDQEGGVHGDGCVCVCAFKDSSAFLLRYD